MACQVSPTPAPISFEGVGNLQACAVGAGLPKGRGGMAFPLWPLTLREPAGLVKPSVGEATKREASRSANG